MGKRSREIYGGTAGMAQEKEVNLLTFDRPNGKPLSLSMLFNLFIVAAVAAAAAAAVPCARARPNERPANVFIVICILFEFNLISWNQRSCSGTLYTSKWKLINFNGDDTSRYIRFCRRFCIFVFV